MNELKHYATPPSLDTPQVDYFLLDGSSSMYGQWWDVLTAIDTFVETIKLNNLTSNIILATFDSGCIHFVHRDEPIANWKPLRDEPIGSYGGSTPLYDAISEVARRLRDTNPPRASIVIATDGEENASHYTSQEQAKSLITWMRAKGWQVTFIGCDWDNEQLAHSLGVEASAAIGVSRAKLSDATRALAEKRAKYARSGAPMHWTDEERQQFGGYLGNMSE